MKKMLFYAFIILLKANPLVVWVTSDSLASFYQKQQLYHPNYELIVVNESR